MPRSARQSQRTKRKEKFSSEVKETVILKKPFGLRINKVDLTVTLVEPRGPSVGQVGVGDKIIAINHKELKTIGDLNRQLANLEKEAKVTLKRFGFSCCKHMITTVETLTIEKGASLKVMRAIEVYTVQIRMGLFPDMDLSEELGLSVKYDNKEQLQVAQIVPGSLASVHLRPGDIIKEVNGVTITSKTMLIFWIRHGFKKEGEVRMLIETGVEDDMHIEMPEDVQQIAQKHLTTLKSMKPPKNAASLAKKTNPSGGKHISIVPEATSEIKICSDYDETTLKHVTRKSH